MVDDLLDKQSNALSRVTYSYEVESEMRKHGYKCEAEFCRLMRRWYEAEDESSLSVDERFLRRMDMRKFLLDGVSFCQFPPYGSHINGIPYVMFEGLMTNVDRRLQLHAIAKRGKYNVRAPSSLDSENFFAEFQSLDPKGSGVLFADDIPKAMETAAYILNSRVNPNRSFHIRTTKRPSVYQVHTIGSSALSESHETLVEDDGKIHKLILRNHEFDERKRQNVKRRMPGVSNMDCPARGTRPIRENYRKDESKILPHIRHGISDAAIDC